MDIKTVWTLRHGVYDMDTGRLTERGIEQVERSASGIIVENGLILTSSELRAIETGEVIQNYFGIERPAVESDLLALARNGLYKIGVQSTLDEFLDYFNEIPDSDEYGPIETLIMVGHDKTPLVLAKCIAASRGFDRDDYNIDMRVPNASGFKVFFEYAAFTKSF